MIKNILLNITSGVKEITLDELSEISEYAQEAAGNKANIIFGSCKDEQLNEQVAVTIIVTGFGASSIPELHSKMSHEKKVVGLDNVYSEPDNIQQNNEEMAISQKTLIFEEKENKTEIDHLHDFYKTKPENEKPDEKEQVDFQVDTEETNTTYDLMDPDNIDEIEKIPAYKRNQQNINNKNNYSEKSEVSKYTLKNENDKTTLNDSNSFLYDNVD
jgi:cell division protein FtsZ